MSEIRPEFRVNKAVQRSDKACGEEALQIARARRKSTDNMGKELVWRCQSSMSACVVLRSLAKGKQTGRYASSEEDSLTPTVHQTFLAASASASLPFFHGFSLKYSIGVLVSGLTAAGAARSFCGERACRSWSESVKREAV